MADRRLLKDQISFLEAEADEIRERHRSAAAAAEHERKLAKRVLAREAVRLRSETAATQERINHLQQAFDALFKQCSEENIDLDIGPARKAKAWQH